MGPKHVLLHRLNLSRLGFPWIKSYLGGGRGKTQMGDFRRASHEKFLFLQHLVKNGFPIFIDSYINILY